MRREIKRREPRARRAIQAPKALMPQESTDENAKSKETLHVPRIASIIDNLVSTSAGGAAVGFVLPLWDVPISKINLSKIDWKMEAILAFVSISLYYANISIQKRARK